jgi:rRNA-processing protein FCF1
MNELPKHGAHSAALSNGLSEYPRHLSDLVPNGDITCITIDTNVIIDHGNLLSEGLVAQLAQFCGQPIQFLITDVVIGETKKHVAAAHEHRIAILRKLSQGASRYLERGPELEWLKEEIEAIRPAKDFAEEEIKAFLEATHAIVIDADYISTGQILDSYFAGSAPFTRTGAKKCEFPDAIALGGIESWARQTGSGILV